MMLRPQLLHPRSRASRIFDALRWFSAFYVMVYHLRPVLFKGYSQLPEKGIFVKGFYAATSMGYEFVMLFFVLSGYLISSSVLKTIREGTWSWKLYLINRMTRLWLVLIPALLLTSFWAQLQSAFFYAPMELSWRDFFGNLFFLQGIYVTNFGGNIPLWSLSYEFWYYLLFPCLLLAFVSKQKKAKLIYGIVAIGVALFIGKTIVMYFSIWLLGTLLAVLPKAPIPKGVLTKWIGPLITVILGATLFLSKYWLGENELTMETRFAASLACGVMFAALLYVVFHAWNQPEATSVFVKRPFEFHTFMAGFSYTLYLTHYPLVNLIRVWLGDGKWGVWNLDAYHIVSAFLAGGAVLVYAWVVSLITEAHTSSVRTWVIRSLGSRRSSKKVESQGVRL